MSDLSRLLEDVYGDGGASEAPLPAPPAWSSDEALDDTFAEWVPGPPADAPAAERAFAVDDEPVAAELPAPSFEDVFAAFAPDDPSGLDADVPVARLVVDDDVEGQPAVEVESAQLTATAELPELDDLLDAADLSGFDDDRPSVSAWTPGPSAEPIPLPAPVPSLRWMPSDDDILPARGSAKRRVKPARTKDVAPSAPRLQLSRKKSPAAPAVVDPAAWTDGTDEQLFEKPSRRGRKPAPKHAKPKARFQLARGKTPADAGAEVEVDAAAAVDLDAAASAPKRKSFRLR